MKHLDILKIKEWIIQDKLNDQYLGKELRRYFWENYIESDIVEEEE